MKHLHSTSFGAFTLTALGLTLLVMTGGARAETTATSGSTAGAVVAPQNIGNPTINTYGADRVRYSGMPVASAGTTIVNAPSSDTCNDSGDAVAFQTGPLAINANKGGEMQLQCNDRADTRSMVESREDAVAITMRHCQNANKAAAYEDAADLRDAIIDRMEPEARAKAPVSFRCPDRLRPEWALEREGKTRPVQTTAAPERPLPKPWMAGG